MTPADVKAQAEALLAKAELELAAARALIAAARPTPANRGQACRLLSGVQATCETVRLSIR